MEAALRGGFFFARWRGFPGAAWCRQLGRDRLPAAARRPRLV